MGNTADDHLTERAMCRILGGAFKFPSDGNSHRIERFMDEAEVLAAQEKMPFEHAMRIVSGKARPAYGTPRPR